jgi:hypothetical protein
MNLLIYNISLLILFSGIIMMTVYITRATTNNFMTSEQKLLMNQNLRRKEPVANIYDYRVSEAYEKMFSQPSIWLGYQDFDPEYQTEKIFIKQNKKTFKDCLV